MCAGGFVSGENLSEKLKVLADKYENVDFIISDPSQFTRRYKKRVDCEAASFVAAMLSFGSRKQFIPKIDFIFQTAGESFAEWILRGGGWLKSPTGNDNDKFYRFYSYNDMNDLFGELSEILREWKSLGECVKQKWFEAKDCYFEQSRSISNPNRQIGGGRGISQAGGSTVYLDTIIANLFPKSRIVSKGKNSANKRTNMFLRWMVRGNSPVDVGLWDWYCPANLLMPLDVHVMHESIKLGLLPKNAKADRKTAIALTQKMKEIWSDDPCKGDFALFGLGISLRERE